MFYYLCVNLRANIFQNIIANFIIIPLDKIVKNYKCKTSKTDTSKKAFQSLITLEFRVTSWYAIYKRVANKRYIQENACCSTWQKENRETIRNLYSRYRQFNLKRSIFLLIRRGWSRIEKIVFVIYRVKHSWCLYMNFPHIIKSSSVSMLIDFLHSWRH